MTLESLEYIIVDMALKNNLVNSAFAGGSLYSLNAESIKEYPFIFVSPAGTHTEKLNTTRYSLVLYYADRLEQDSSNETTVASVAIETLKNLKRQLGELEFVVEVQAESDIRLFTETEKMSDRLTGAYLTFWVEVLNVSTCPTYFDETGAPLGNYIYPEIPINVLDNLASKEWVLKKIREIGGVTLDDVDREIDKKLRPYATVKYVDESIAAISGGTAPELSAITHDIQELSATTQDLQNQIDALSGGTSPELSGITHDIEVLSAITSANTHDILVLSGYTHESVSSLTQSIEVLSQAISAATPADYDEVKAQVSANTESIQTLSGVTGGLADGLAELSGVTSGLSDGLSELSGVTGGLESGLAELSGVTSGLTAQIAGKQDVLSGSTHISVQNSIVSSVDLVASSNIDNIWVGTVADYELIPTKNPRTLYITL